MPRGLIALGRQKEPLLFACLLVVLLTCSPAAATAAVGDMPVGTILINSGSSVSSGWNVELSLTATDPDGTVTHMRIWNDGTDKNARPWESVDTTKQWTLAYGDGGGVRSVWVEFKDDALNVSTPVSDDITVDTFLPGEDVNPTGSVVINGGAATTDSQVVELSLSASDSGGSGLAFMRFLNAFVFGQTWSAWELYGTTKSWTLAPGEGVKYVWAQYLDGGGNASSQPADSIMLVEGPPQISIWPRWSSAPYGYWSKLAGTVIDGWGDPIDGTGVALQYEEGSTWKPLKTVTTNSSGYYQHWFYYGGGTRSYRAEHMASGVLSNLTTPTFTNNITAWNNYRPKVKYCQWTKIHGLYGGPNGVFPNTTLYMQRKSGSSWVWQATVKTDSTGYYASWAPVCPTTTFRMATAGSVVKSATVTKIGSSLTAWSNSRVHTVLKDGFGNPVKSQTVYLQRWNGSGWGWAATGTTSGTGYAGFTPSAQGVTYRTATWGSAITSGSVTYR